MRKPFWLKVKLPKNILEKTFHEGLKGGQACTEDGDMDFDSGGHIHLIVCEVVVGARIEKTQVY